MGETSCQGQLEKSRGIGVHKVNLSAAGSTPNLDIRVLQSSLDQVFRADPCFVEISISRLLRCRNSGGGTAGGSARKIFDLRASSVQIIQQAFQNSDSGSDFI